MKHLIYLFLLLCYVSKGQIQFDFEDGKLNDWIQTPSEHWEVSQLTPLSGENSLHHSFDNPSPGIDYIAREIMYPKLNDTIRFSFKIRHSYNPSSGNNWQFFMLANDFKDIIPEFTEKFGMILGVNYYASNDTIGLWQLLDGTSHEICKTSLNFQEEIGTKGVLSIQVTRIPDGNWSIEVSDAGTEEGFSEIGSGTEIAPSNGKYFGFRYMYSSAQDRKLWIDSIYITGEFSFDREAPEILSLHVESPNSIQLIFSERPQFGPNLSILWNKTSPDTLHINGNMLTVIFDKVFPNRVGQELYISGIEDLEKNALIDTILNFRLDLPDFGDLVINEIMADPEPVVYLSDCEYIEIYNRDESVVEMNDWQIAINSRNYDLPACMILPGDYLVLRPEGCKILSEGIIEIAAFSASSVLPNSKATVVLTDQFGRVIHKVVYNTNDYDTDKSEGGWSLECIDPDNLCGGISNWGFSFDSRGGSPGEINSIDAENRDIEAPELLFMGLPSDEKISLTFNEAIFLDQNSGISTTLNGENLDINFLHQNIVESRIDMISPVPLHAQQNYTLDISGIQDCSGKESPEIIRNFQIPVLAKEISVLLNEIMYDPLDGEEEYIEIINSSEKYIDLKDLKFILQDSDGSTSNSLFLSQESHLLAPHAIAVFCKRGRKLRDQWNLDWAVDVIEIEGWKSLPDKGATVLLADRSERTIDELYFNDSLHNVYFDFCRGVSLERMGSNCKNCWSSASYSANFGTPGKINSQSYAPGIVENNILISPEVFSPDQDGFEDVLAISISNTFQNSFVDIMITDLNGIIVTELARKAYIGSEDIYYWDGTDQEGHLVFPGIYIVHVQAFDKPGFINFRKACALVYR